jgi:hypothetical protein
VPPLDDALPPEPLPPEPALAPPVLAVAPPVLALAPPVLALAPPVLALAPPVEAELPPDPTAPPLPGWPPDPPSEALGEHAASDVRPTSARAGIRGLRLRMEISFTKTVAGMALLAAKRQEDAGRPGCGQSARFRTMPLTAMQLVPVLPTCEAPLSRTPLRLWPFKAMRACATEPRARRQRAKAPSRKRFIVSSPGFG